MVRDRPYERVLGVYPCQTGFAFAVIERRRGLIDWGEAELGKQTADEFVARVALEVGRCSPALLVVEDCSRTSRGDKAQTRIEATLELATRLGLATGAISRTELRESLSLKANANKHEVADRLCSLYPELMPQRPIHSIWKKDPRMNVFDAVALAAAAIGCHEPHGVLSD